MEEKKRSFYANGAEAPQFEIPYDPTPEPELWDFGTGEYIETAKLLEAMKIPAGVEIDFTLVMMNDKKEARTRRFTEVGQIKEYFEALREARAWVDENAQLRESEVSPEHRDEFDTQSKAFLREKMAQPERHLREGWSDGTDGFYDGSMDINTIDSDAYTPIIGGMISHQLYLYDFLKMQAKAFWLKNHDPISAHIVRTFTDFVVGKGIEFQATNPIVNEFWQNYCKKYKVSEKAKTIYSDSVWNGNILTRFMPDPQDPGAIKMYILDPSTVWEIVTDPADIDTVYFYHQQYPTAYQIFTKGGIEAQKYIIEQIPGAQVVHIKYNAVSNEKWGRSDLFPIFDDLKRLKDYYNSQTLKSIQQANFTWNLIINAAPEEIQGSLKPFIDNFIKSLYRPGSVTQTSVDQMTGKPSIEVSPFQADGASGNMSALGKELTGRAAVGVGFPLEFINQSDGASRATAIERTSPFYRMIESRQQKMNDFMQEWFTRVVKHAQASGRLPRTQIRKAVISDILKLVKAGELQSAEIMIETVQAGGEIEEPLDTSIRFIFPSLIQDDRSQLLKDLAMLYNSGDGVISRETLANHAVAQFIRDFDWEAELEKIKQEKEEGEAAQMATVGTMYPNPSARTQTRQDVQR